MTKKTDTWMPLYVGDYLADTSRLTTEQHGAYLLILMDYWRNGPPPDDDEVLASITKLPASRWKSTRPALARFFSVADGMWRQKRADQEKQDAADISGKRSAAGKEGASKRWGKDDGKGIANAMANASQNDAPSPSHSSSLTGKKRARAVAPPCPPDVDAQVWEDWHALRRAKKAPVTLTVIDGAKAQALKAGLTLEAFLRIWCRRGTQGLEAEWLKPAELQQYRQSFAERTTASKSARLAEMTGGLLGTLQPGAQGAVIDLEAPHAPRLTA